MIKSSQGWGLLNSYVIGVKEELLMIYFSVWAHAYYEQKYPGICSSRPLISKLVEIAHQTGDLHNCPWLYR